VERDPHLCALQPSSLLDPGWLRRSLALLLAAGGLISLTWIAVAGEVGPAAAIAVVTISLVCLGLAAWTARDDGRPPRVQLMVVLLACGPGVTLEVALTGATHSPRTARSRSSTSGCCPGRSCSGTCGVLSRT
jgi:hypothetical protein